MCAVVVAFALVEVESDVLGREGVGVGKSVRVGGVVTSGERISRVFD